MLTAKQREVWQKTVNSPCRWNISVGAVRSGKTYLDYYRIPYRIMHADIHGGIAIAGNTEASVERNILAPMRQMFGEKLVGRVRNGGAVRLFGRDCFVLGAFRSSSADKLQGASLAYCYGDEITTWSEDVFRMIMSRLDKATSVFDGSCNPAHPSHWFKQFLDTGEAEGNVQVHTFTIDHNTYLPEDFVETLKKEYAGTVYYDRFISGKWKIAEGLIYRQFADHTADFIAKAKASEIVMADIGVDFGGNGSATAFNLTGYTAGYKKIYTLDEYYRKGVFSPAELERDFVSFVRCAKKKYPALRDVYCDSAEQVLIKGLKNAARKARLPIEIHNAKKGDICQRIRFYSALMGSGRYFISPQCRHTIDAFARASWEQDSYDKRLDDGSANIDSLDAQEYSTEHRMNEILSVL